MLYNLLENWTQLYYINFSHMLILCISKKQTKLGNKKQVVQLPWEVSSIWDELLIPFPNIINALITYFTFTFLNTIVQGSQRYLQYYCLKPNSEFILDFKYILLRRHLFYNLYRLRQFRPRIHFSSFPSG